MSEQRRSRILLVTLTALCLCPVIASANPQGGLVASGKADITSAGKTLTVQQATPQALIDWRSFDIAPGEVTRFNQPSSTSLTVNRINDMAPSKIEGTLSANGNLVLINANGIVFGKDSKVDAAGILATTTGINEKQFKSGKLVFDQPGRPDAKIQNAGTITAKDLGLVGIVAPQVENDGTIRAKLGKVNLSSGDAFTLDLAGDGLINLAVTGPIKDQIAGNAGLIEAQGGEVYLSAAAARDAVNSLVTNTGAINASAVGSKAGMITPQLEPFVSQCLVVDDSEDCRFIARKIISERLGFSCRTASSGQEALTACERKMPDLILLDWHMFGMSGLQFLDRLKHLPGGFRVKVVMCTGEGSSRRIDEARAAGVNGYVLKPYSEEDIAKQLSHLRLRPSLTIL